MSTATQTISFARGAPSADILPAEAVRTAAAAALQSDWQRALSYGTGRGHAGLAEWIAELHGIEPAQVMVTNGSMEAAALLFQHVQRIALPLRHCVVILPAATRVAAFNLFHHHLRAARLQAHD